jgi:hypothetical protein
LAVEVAVLAVVLGVVWAAEWEVVLAEVVLAEVARAEVVRAEVARVEAMAEGSEEVVVQVGLEEGWAGLGAWREVAAQVAVD